MAAIFQDENDSVVNFDRNSDQTNKQMLRVASAMLSGKDLTRGLKTLGVKRKPGKMDNGESAFIFVGDEARTLFANWN